MNRSSWYARLISIAIFLTSACAAFAHGDDAPEPLDPKVFAPAGKLIAAILVVAIIGYIWYTQRISAIRKEAAKARAAKERETK